MKYIGIYKHAWGTKYELVAIVSPTPARPAVEESVRRAIIRTLAEADIPFEQQGADSISEFTQLLDVPLAVSNAHSQEQSAGSDESRLPDYEEGDL